MQPIIQSNRGRPRLVLCTAALVLLGGLYWAESRAPGADADPGAGALESIAVAPRSVARPRAVDDGGGRPSIEPRAAAAANARPPVEPDPEAHDDPLDRLPASDRVERHRAELERALAELAEASGPAHERLRLEAAGTLTRLRPELGTTPEGRRELHDYNTRFHATAAQ